MKASLIILALTLSASPALAETASQTPPLTPEIPAHGVRTFTPTEFEQNLFKDRSAISQTSGEDVYRALCQGCHMADRQGASGAGSYPALAGNRMVSAPDASSLIQVTLAGSRMAQTPADRMTFEMPGFDQLDDGDGFVELARQGEAALYEITACR